LIAGLPVSIDDLREQVVYEVAYALVQPRPVSLGLYQMAQEHIGDAGLVDVTVLIGWFTMVCMTLAAFDVPASADITGPTSRHFSPSLQGFDFMPNMLQATLGIVAEFPEHFFLENLAVRSDGSILVTVMNRKELWLVPKPDGGLLVQPVHLATFEFNTLFIVEWQPDCFLLGVADVYDTRRARLYKVDLTGWSPGSAITSSLMLELPKPWFGLNGACFVAPDILLAAGMAGLIWRVDLRGETPSARIWLQHDSMKNRPGEKKPEQPGINGVQFDAKNGYLYYTTTSQQLMLRVKVDPATHDPVDLPEFVAGGREWDDFLIDEAEGVAYVTTHRENTIDRVCLAHDGNRAGRTVIAGDPFNEILVGPSAGAWGRAPGEFGRIAYFTTDGGTAQPPDGTYRTAKILRFGLRQEAAP
jgi:hypothetical protein